MSRIGRKPIAVPAGVDVKIDGHVVTVKGPKGTLTKSFHKDMIIKLEGNEIIVERPTEDKLHKSLHGLTRTLVSNMVEGVTHGFSKSLDSHQVIVPEIDGITIDVPAATKIIVNGIDKQAVGQFAAEIREKRPPEPYKGKGIHYTGEHIIRKEGKAGKGKK